MIVVSNLNSRDSEETLTDFPLGENSKYSPKFSRSKFSSRSKSSYTDGFWNTGQLIFKMMTR